MFVTPLNEIDMRVVAPSNAAQDRLCQPDVLRGDVLMNGANIEFNMATLSSSHEGRQTGVRRTRANSTKQQRVSSFARRDREVPHLRTR
jgi:hypothetical protein